MRSLSVSIVSSIVVLVLLVGGCSSAAPPAAPTQPAAAPTKAPAVVAPTAAPPVVTAAPTSAPAKKVDYPVAGKVITFLVPSAPGGTTDRTVRMLAPVFEKDLGVPVQVVNKPGANTMVGAYEVAKAKPDGYTFGLFSLSSITQGYIDSEKQVPVNGRQDFQLIGMTSVDPSILIVLSSTPYKIGKDLMDAAKANPGKISIGSSGLFSSNHLAMAGVENAAGVQFGFVHFQSAGEAVTEVLGNHVIGGAVTIGGSSAEHVKAGTLRILGISGSQRSRFYPDLKTWQEQGYNSSYVAPYAVAGPAGLPKEIVDILSNELKKALDSDTIKKQAEGATMSLQFMDAAQTDAYWAKYEPEVKTLVDLAKKPR